MAVLHLWLVFVCIWSYHLLQGVVDRYRSMHSFGCLTLNVINQSINQTPQKPDYPMVVRIWYGFFEYMHRTMLTRLAHDIIILHTFTTTVLSFRMLQCLSRYRLGRHNLAIQTDRYRASQRESSVFVERT